MTAETFLARLHHELQALDAAGLTKTERVITGPQGAQVRLADDPQGQPLINLCANNYLGLSAHPQVMAAAQAAIDSHGFGLSSVRFICGTQDIHKQLEQRIARFLGLDDAILYAAAFDANGGLFEPLLGEQDAIVSDALNHASIIDGIRLCKAQRYRYRHDDMADLAAQLQAARAAGAREVLVFSDGVFSMDGTIARLDEMRTLCDAHGAILAIDECHATGFMGATGRGTHEHRGLLVDGRSRVDLITGTFGKALGGASGGFTAGPRAVIELLRQRSRPYLFSNTLAPAIVGASLAVLDLLEASTSLRDTLHANTAHFRAAIAAAGFEIKPGTHPIVPIMVYDAVKAQQLAARLRELGMYVTGFFYPVVPQGQARVRVQVSAAHTVAQLDRAVAAFAQAGRELGLLP
ncbi:glycine C-acetyltransferase [Aquabacterium sp. OR-4]|uniref:glycine C-acetyltransferase n=1 Tax=Aquabacterium sp. OR-4 TaxID=2978127 RepID=UPI0021B4A9EB|nr:glycine C-acetyltransferase [Aquabacterium sp. OR-4]MDT7835404.1 glycine C-acetyltransferase [Aquabacterium sp. OR-4]